MISAIAPIVLGMSEALNYLPVESATPTSRKLIGGTNMSPEAPHQPGELSLQTFEAGQLFSPAPHFIRKFRCSPTSVS